MKVSIEQLHQLFMESSGVVTDSRKITEGSIFFALKGDNFDGNNYALEALSQGAAYSVVDSLKVNDDRVIVVDDVLTTLQKLAREHRRKLAIKIVAITGSNGKTTTKELIAQVLKQRYNIFATKGNFNNHIGVPLTLLSFDTRCTDPQRETIGVVEMGASSQGEIAALCAIAEPNYGVITNIGNAHLDGFGGIEGVRKGKGELTEYIKATNGVFFAAKEDAEVSTLCEVNRVAKIAQYSYSIANGAESQLIGEYNRYNIATAMAIAQYLGVPISESKELIAQYKPTNNRSQSTQTENNKLLVDCYNANPSSMEVALINFTKERGSKIAIIGDMNELGEWSEREHDKILNLALKSGAERVIVVGDKFAIAAQKINEPKVESFKDSSELIEDISKNSIKNRVILLKASRSIGLESLLPYL